MFSPDFEDTTFSAKTDERESAFDLPAKPPRMPKGKKKRKKAWKHAQRDRDQLLMQIGRERRENELLRDVIRMSTAAANRQLDTRTAKTGLALTNPRKKRKGGGRR